MERSGETKMIRKSFYDDDERWTPDALILEKEIRKSITPIIKKWGKKGYYYMDIEDVVRCVVEYTCATERVVRYMTEKKNE